MCLDFNVKKSECEEVNKENEEKHKMVQQETEELEHRIESTREETEKFRE